MSSDQAVLNAVQLRTSPAWHRWLLATIMLATIALGWRFPLLGLVVPVVMATALVTSLRRGRYACGHYCPRGSFYDSWFLPLAGDRPLSRLWQTPPVRWGLFVLLLGGMAVQIAANPGDLRHWGTTFWLACTLTTLFGLGLGIAYHGRAWCGVCPIGTLSARLGRGKESLRIAASCRNCGVCERSCPMRLDIAVHRTSGTLPHADCIKCATCTARCPQQALSWPPR